MLALVSSTTVMAYSFYTFSAPNLPPNHLMMLTIPFVLYGLFRYLYLIHVKGETDPPDVVVLKDRAVADRHAAVRAGGVCRLLRGAAQRVKCHHQPEPSLIVSRILFNESPCPQRTGAFS